MNDFLDILLLASFTVGGVYFSAIRRASTKFW